MSKIDYDQSKDVLIHVGDLIAKGDKNEEVLQWMIKHSIQGVRGNHDQPVRMAHHLSFLILMDIGCSMASMDAVGGW
jgi:predicted phosphodiesterase